MRLVVEYPVDSATDGGSWLEPANIAAFARTAEKCDVDGIAFTDHPAPPRRWLDAGGHETLDPFAALAFCAAATSRLRLMTWLAVLPYRNPFLTVKSMTTLDILSGGRTRFVVGTGYLKPEFDALGVDFGQRNRLFEEAIEIIDRAWQGEDITWEGTAFTANGQAIRPRPPQPSAPLWFGGNSAVVRDRVARFGRGWAPFLSSRKVAGSARTAAIASLEDLAASIADLSDRLRAAGRDHREVAVLVGGDGIFDWRLTRADRRDQVRYLASIGVTHAVASFVGQPYVNVDHMLSEISTYRDVLNKE